MNKNLFARSKLFGVKITIDNAIVYSCRQNTTEDNLDRGIKAIAIILDKTEEEVEHILKYVPEDKQEFIKVEYYISMG